MDLQREDDIDPLLALGLQDFSYSRLNTYQQCELKYFYSYVLKYPQDFGHAAKLGNIIHEALELTLENEAPINLHELIENYHAARVSYDPEQKIPEVMIEDGLTMLQEFKADHPGEQNIYAKELPFSFILGPARFNGFIDLVSVYDSYVLIRDYKSGKKEVPYKQVPTNLQLGIYALYMKSLFPDKDIHAELYYLRTGKARGHRFTDDDLQQVKLKLLALVKEILNKERFDATPNERECRWCDYAKNGLCPTGRYRIDSRRDSLYQLDY